MAEKKPERKRSLAEQTAEDEAQGETADGRIILTNDSGHVKKVTAEEWDNEERQAELLKAGWKVMGSDAESEK